MPCFFSIRLNLILALGLVFSEVEAQVSPPRLIAPPNQATAVRVNPSFVWSATPQATSYDLQLADDSVFGSSLTVASGLSDTTFRYTGLEHKLVYYWRVRAVNAAGPGPFSAAFSFRTRAPSPGLPVASADAYPALRHAAGIFILTGDAFETADVSGDNTVGAYDAALVLQFAAGLIGVFPVDR